MKHYPIPDHPIISDPIPGRCYQVLCARHLEGGAPVYKQWFPVLAPIHDDKDIIDFQSRHLHYDSRFLSSKTLSQLTAWREEHSVIASVFVLDDKNPAYSLEFSLRRRKCQRKAFSWLDVDLPSWGYELHEAHRGCRLENGHICPHRGIDVRQGPLLAGGYRVCPGHGLVWAADGTLAEFVP